MQETSHIKLWAESSAIKSSMSLYFSTELTHRPLSSNPRLECASTSVHYHTYYHGSQVPTSKMWVHLWPACPVCRLPAWGRCVRWQNYLNSGSADMQNLAYIKDSDQNNWPKFSCVAFLWISATMWYVLCAFIQGFADRKCRTCNVVTKAEVKKIDGGWLEDMFLCCLENQNVSFL